MVGFGHKKSRCFTPNCGGKATCSHFSKFLLLELGLPVGVFLRRDLSGFQLVSLRSPGLEHLGRLGRFLGRRVDRKTRAILSGHNAELVLGLMGTLLILSAVCIVCIFICLGMCRKAKAEQDAQAELQQAA